ncbi:MAG: thiamine pyrophosphate-dependent dehydrogenase E1 component subunit alpha [Rhodospirillales bacterium]|nr:thiamine pyrophosphate-dependent dehydrogenase E1 component subunit alpha [Rhodospirillales bacterium]
MNAAAATPAQPEAEAAPYLALLGQMMRIRAFEEQARRLFASGQVPGLLHLCSGQEAMAVGVCSALRPTDVIASNHRGHGHCLAKGADPARLMAEILGCASGYGLGRGGSMHVFDPANGNIGTNGIVGGGIPLAAGAALSAQRRGTDGVAAGFFGDGALNQGLLFEVLNMAAIWRLPVLFVCENNGYGEFTAIETVTAGKSMIARGQVFDIPAEHVDGMDVLAVRAAAERAVARARAGEGPSFIVGTTYRYGGHHAGDAQDYKDKVEAEAWQKKDPIPRLARHLIERGLASAAHIDALGKEVEAAIEEAVKAAKAAAPPTASDLVRHLYA